MAQGQVTTEANDGLTTRQRRNRPILLVHSGTGKGKSTAAFGLALRALASPLMLGGLLFSAGCFWLLLRWRQRGASAVG